MRQQLYDAVVNGVETTFLLTDEQAEFRGLDPADGRPVTATKGRRPSNKAAAAPANKAAEKPAE